MRVRYMIREVEEPAAVGEPRRFTVTDQWTGRTLPLPDDYEGDYRDLFPPDGQ